MQKSPSLYTAATELQLVAQEIIEHEGELTPEIEEKIQYLNYSVSEKADSVAHVLREASDRIEKEKTRIKEKQEWVKKAEKSLERFNSYVEACINLLGETEIKGEESRLVIKKGLESVKVDESKIEEIEKVSPKLVRVKTVKSPDKAEIKKAIREGKEIPGASLVRGKDKVVVKSLKVLRG